MNEFGNLVREMRRALNVKLREMAVELDVSVAFLSAVEVGLKAPTDDLVAKIAGFFRKRRHFKTMQIAALYATAARVRRAIDVGDLNGQGREAVAYFARKWRDMDQATRDKFFQEVEKAKGK